MCGLIGFSGTKSYDYKHIRFLLFWNSIERGTDATGVFTPKTGIVKDNISAKSFLTNKKLISKVSLDNNFIGHVRAKTVGVNTAKNAHPFEYDDVVLAHNGTLQYYHELVKMYQLNYGDYDVDSQVLAKCVAVNTKYDDRIKVLEQYEGAAALLWYNKKEDILYAYHDKERPLFYGYINKTEMYISSIKESLEAIFCEDIKAFDTSVLYKINNGKIISEEKYNNRVRDILIEIILASEDDVVKNKKKKKVWYTSNKPNISGFEIKDFIPEYARGYWIMCDSAGFVTHNSAVNKKHDLLYMGEWYYVIGKAYGDSYNNLTSFMELQNSKDETGIFASTSKFNSKEFIPQVGKYVVSMVNLSYTNSNQQICKIGDFLLVKSHTYGDPSISVVNPYNGLSGKCNIGAVRVARKEETKKYLKEFQKTIDFVDVVAPTCEVESPFKEDVKNLLPAIVDNIKKDYKDLTFSYGTICNLLSKLIEDTMSIRLKMEANDINEGIKISKSLEDDLILLFDPDFLETLIPNDERENEEFHHFEMLKN